jgi:DNA modification methylase
VSHTKFELRSTRTLHPNPDNVRTHSKKQQRLVTDIISQVGFINPITVNSNGKILGGHARYMAAKSLGLQTVPVIVVGGLTEAEEQAYILADNRVAEKAGWDRAGLATQLNLVAPLLAQEGLSVELTGFEPAEIEGLMGDLIDPEQDPIDELPQLASKPISRAGDLWQLDRHRLYCGDAGEASDVRALMGRERAAMIFADPPFNVRIGATVGRGKVKHREFAFASGEMSPSQFIVFLKKWMRLAAQFSADGSIHYVCIDWRHLAEMLAAGEEVYSELKNVVVWAKTNAGQGSLYRSQHEFVFVFKNGEAPHQNNIELGRHGRNRSNVWTYAGVNTFRSGRLEELSVHPTVKPVALVADAMRDCSRRGDIILDPFMGSGTTILAAERVGRRGYGLEIDPLYVDVAIRRWQDFTKQDAILKATGQTFDEVAASRPLTRVRITK